LNRNLSISGSESGWQQYVLVMILAGLITPLILYLTIIIIDPYDSVAFSPKWDRYPPRGDHRHWNAKLLKNSSFDSLVLGSSTAMLLNPEELNVAMGARFVNLGMPLATPYEQMRLLSLFAHYHNGIKMLIVSVDTLWCHPKGMPEHANSRLVNAYPDWLYDTHAWNDLPPLNKTSVKAAYDQARALLGIYRPYSRWMNGYEDLTKTLHEKNNPEDIRKRIHEGTPEPLLTGNKRITIGNGYHYPDIERLALALQALSPATMKILIFPPYHARYQPKPGSEQAQLWEGCKQDVASLSNNLDNILVMDFMVQSELTQKDVNYIDGYHTTTETASEIVRLISSAIQHKDYPQDQFRILNRSNKD
jgi:hypothetical protein